MHKECKVKKKKTKNPAVLQTDHKSKRNDFRTMPQWVPLLQLQKRNYLKQGRTQQATPGTWTDLQTYFKLYCCVFRGDSSTTENVKSAKTPPLALLSPGKRNASNDLSWYVKL